MNKSGWLITILIVAVNVTAIIARWRTLPEILPAHFDLQGNASGSMARTMLLLYPLASAVVCLIAYLIAGKKPKLQTGISLVLLSSALVTLTSGSMPFFMLAEPVILLVSVIAFIISVIKSRK